MDTLSKTKRSVLTLLNVVIPVLGFLIIVAILHAVFIPRGPIYPMCKNNIKEMAVAILVYGADYDNRLPSSMLVNHSRNWNKSDFLTFTTKVGTLPPTGHRQTYVEILYDYLKSKDIMFCDYDSSRENPDNNTPPSYFWKTAIDKAWYGEGCRKPFQKITDFKYEADQIILYERAPFSNDKDSLGNGDTINVAYLDSHVRTIRLRNASSGDPTHPAGNDDGEPMYFNHNVAQDKGLSSDRIPAEFVDPSVYGDRL